ncbi:MAG: hypothetical protein KGI50_00155 [Patescibacteria group bacterium]|nr:hypothetical protein [Patescibacteria group bacterium]MDE2438226.1 hypothetical protein [Patescibacteria group bacterium]
MNFETLKQENLEGEQIQEIELGYDDIVKMIPVFKKYGILYHGTSSSMIEREVLSPDTTYVISEKGRKKNLDKVFLTKDKGSAWIYAKRAANSYGGVPRVLDVVPQGSVDVINDGKGTSVFAAPRGIVLSKRLERILEDLSAKE